MAFFLPKQIIKNTYDQIMKRGTIRLGVFTICGGEVSRCRYLVNSMHITLIPVLGIIGHEFGHHWGGHKQCLVAQRIWFARGEWTVTPIFAAQTTLAIYGSRFKQVPLNATLPNVQWSLAAHMRTPRPDSHVNHLERYFAANPLKNNQVIYILISHPALNASLDGFFMRF